jgi:hypothetical protein
VTVWRVVEYAALIVLMLGVLWFAARLLRVPSTRHPGPTVVGNPWVEAGETFSRLLAEHRRAQLTAAVARHSERLLLPSMEEVVPLSQHPGRRPIGERTIPVERIIGSADAGSQLFDHKFRPTDLRSRARFESVYAAMRTGQQLPSIDVFQWQGDYFLSDGLHRVAVARALGQEYLPAEVTQIVA